jgi:hypothetical protein
MPETPLFFIFFNAGIPLFHHFCPGIPLFSPLMYILEGHLFSSLFILGTPLFSPL